tara:strand:+ start:3115 stop:4290 length:1176 start_codon:yes stop_codon:yes gene_type:complete
MRRFRRPLLVLGVLLLLDVLINVTVLADGQVFGVRVAPFSPPLFTEHQEQRIERARAQLARGEMDGFVDADLGWCPRADSELGLYAYDVNAARRSSRPFPDTSTEGMRRIVAVGCSFTRGDEVASDEGWVARLHDGRDDVDLANLGMGGYGLDQARLRMVRDGLPLSPDEVWLGWTPAVSYRVTTVFPPCLRHESGSAAFKPRYRFNAAGELELVPMPVRDLTDFVAAFDEPERLYRTLLATDDWVARSPEAYATYGESWWHFSAAGRFVATVLERGERDPYPSLLDSEIGLATLVTAILNGFADDARARNVRPRLVILPSHPDLVAASKSERPWAAVVDAVRDHMDVCDTTDALLAAGAHQDDAYWASGGHYSAQANAVVADALAATWLD